MKKIIRISLIIFIAVIIALLIIFRTEISESRKVFFIVESLSKTVTLPHDNYNFSISGTISQNEQIDTLNGAISFENGEYFLADVNYHKKNYIVKSDDSTTNVFIGQSNIIVSANGENFGDFDFVKLLGKILEDYPQTNKFINLSLFEKIGIVGWIVSQTSQRDTIENNSEYTILYTDKDSTNIQLWLNENDKEFLLKSNSPKLQINLALNIEEKIHEMQIPINEETKIINISRDELNTAIYRGALRTGGLLLSKIEAPKVDKAEKSYGNGKLIVKEGNRVLIAKGTHRELGEIQGHLLQKEIKEMIDATLYTMCWVYTSERKSWFIDDFRDAYKRLQPFIPKRFDEEMQGMAEASGISIDEIRLTNVFPALFHCSGFALFNTCTVDGKLYHGRVLDYIVDLGLQFDAVVYMFQPEGYNAFANVGYAGFIGSVTGMNDKQVSFGEMGGGGEGDWDGMPMAFLMRDGMERANTLEEAVNIFQNTPRTCEYYYVIADGKIPDARGLSTTPTRFEIIHPNQYHVQLTEPIENSVLMSAGSRYKELASRVKNNFGNIDAEKAIRLMDRPVAMKSNLHNALFAPQSLEFWVANAGVNKPAAFMPYTHYTFSELLSKLN